MREERLEREQRNEQGMGTSSARKYGSLGTVPTVQLRYEKQNLF
jgi:hypothetical protein